jgi:hypothetical protein
MYAYTHYSNLCLKELRQERERGIMTEEKEAKVEEERREKYRTRASSSRGRNKVTTEGTVKGQRPKMRD